MCFLSYLTNQVSSPVEIITSINFYNASPPLENTNKLESSKLGDQALQLSPKSLFSQLNLLRKGTGSLIMKYSGKKTLRNRKIKISVLKQ